MKQIIKCSSFYQDINSLSNLIANLEFEDSLYGQQIKDFYYIPNELTEFFQMILKEDIEIQPDTGIFRKPSDIIHFDTFYEHSLWTCIVAIEDTVINLQTHKEGYESFYDIKTDVNEFFINESQKPENWKISTCLTLKSNEFVFIRPWVFRSLQSNKLIQSFSLNTKLKQ